MYLLANFMYDLYGGHGIFESKAGSIQNILIADGMQIGKPIAELYLFAFDGKASIGAFALLLNFIGQSFGVDG